MITHADANPDELPDDAGLTILELLVVLVILSLIGGVVAVQLVGQMDRAKVDVAKLQLHQIDNALALFQLDMRRVPTGDEGLGALIAAPQSADGWRGPYLKNASQLDDPWGHRLGYAPGADGHYVLSSFGSDGREGGDGAAADISLQSGG